MHTYYGIGDQEQLNCDIQDCIQYYIDECDPENLPEKIMVHENAPDKASVNVDSMLERVYEWLDDDYGDPDGDSTVPPECVVEKAHDLADLILQHYHVWRCEPTGITFEVDVKKWIANDPDAIREVK
jgi:hypothetical protein